jgi:hypothetical protein
VQNHDQKEKPEWEEIKPDLEEKVKEIDIKLEMPDPSTAYNNIMK